MPLRGTPEAIAATSVVALSFQSLYFIRFIGVSQTNYHDNGIKYISIAKSADCTWQTVKKASKTPSKAATVKDCSQWSVRASQHTSACLFAHISHHVRVLSFEKKERNKAQALDWEAGNEGLCSCFSGSVHCSDSGDKNVACVSLRALACLQNASVLWSRHRPAGGGGWREERGAVRREERG